MKKYLGSRMTAYAAVICPLLVIAPLPFLRVPLYQLSGLYSQYVPPFSVRVRCFLRNDFALDYEKCLGVGIEHYNHNAIHTNIGSKVFFIYLSYDYYETKYRGKINLWKPNERRIKVQFDKNLYEYLLSVLPKKQAMMLQQDFRILFSEK